MLVSQNKNTGRRETLLFRQRDTLRTKEIMETRLSKLDSLPQYWRLLRYLLLTGISEKILRKLKRKSHFRMCRHTFHSKEVKNAEFYIFLGRFRTDQYWQVKATAGPFSAISWHTGIFIYFSLKLSVIIKVVKCIHICTKFIFSATGGFLY